LLARDNIDLQQVRDILSDIAADDKRASEVIDRVHVLIKKREFQPQPLEANQLIRDVLSLMNHELTGRAVRVVTELTAGVLPIRGDRVQLQQVLINLIQNAADSIGQDGEVTLRARLDSKRLADRVTDVVILEVADTGKGITPEVEKRLFDPFFTTKETGTGLGLSIAARMVEKHGGALQYQTQPDHGTTFGIVLPRA